MLFRCLSISSLAALALSAGAQTSPGMLSMSDAVKLARERNGTVGAAYYNYLAAHQASLQSYAAFLPSISTSYTYNADRTSQTLGNTTFVTDTNGSTYSANANWRLFDLGTRNDNFLAARRAEDSSRDTARQTLRQVLFNVQDQYFETLRALELEKVAQIEVDRAQATEDQTKDQVDVGKTAKKELLQAIADLANARVSQIQAKNTTATNVATLKSLIGLPSHEPLPSLESFPIPDTANSPTDLNKVMDEGLNRRPDILSERETVRSLEFTARSAAIAAGVNVTLDATYGAAFSPDYLENRLITFTVSYPLFDGGASRAAAREAGYNVKSARQTLIQAERDARSEIEAAFVTLRQNIDRLTAAKQAYDASLENYNAASDSYKLGANTIIDVLTANVSLITAESNQIQAVYDYYISEVKLRLVTGERLLGEPTNDELAQYH